MAIALLIAGGTALAGHIMHKKAKDKNEQAAYLMQKAQNIFDEEKAKLDAIKDKGHSSLVHLGNLKTNILATSMDAFIDAYSKLKHVELLDQGAGNELSNYVIRNEDVLEVKQLGNIYKSSIKTGSVAMVAAAPFALSAAGVLTPVAIFAAPVIAFTGFSANRKAEQNLEIAQTAIVQAEAAVEEMKVSETLCQGIQRQAELYTNLLLNLNAMFIECTQIFAGMIRLKTSRFNNHVSVSDFSPEEVALAAVTRALAGAIKAVIDVPLLDEQTQVTQESQQTYQQTSTKLPVFSEKVGQVRTFGVSSAVEIIPIEVATTQYKPPKASETDILRLIGGIFGGIAGAMLGVPIGMGLDSGLMSEYTNYHTVIPYIVAMLYGVFSLSILNIPHKATVLRKTKYISCGFLAGGLIGLFFMTAPHLSGLGAFFILNLIIGVVSFFGGVFLLDNPKKKHFMYFGARMLSCVCVFCIALLLFHIMTAWFHFATMVALWIAVIIFTPLVLIAAYIIELTD